MPGQPYILKQVSATLPHSMLDEPTQIDPLPAVVEQTSLRLTAQDTTRITEVRSETIDE